MLKVLLNWLQPQVEAILAEQQADFRAGLSTAEQSLTSASFLKNTFNTSKNCTMLS